MWPLTMQQQLEVMQRRQRLIDNCLTTGMKSQTCATRAIHYRPFVWTADGRPLPAVTRTLQNAADIASSRNGQQMLANSLQHPWKHEIQTALLRRRAAMTRAVLPNPSARAKWLLAGLIDRALNHWGHVPPLGGGIGDNDHATSETDTAIPDDDDDHDIASLASQPSVSVQPSSLQLCRLPLCPLCSDVSG